MQKGKINFEEDEIQDGFDVGKSYFINLELSVYEALDIKEELLTNEDGMGAEVDYYKNLEFQILNKLEIHGTYLVNESNESLNKTSAISLYYRNKWFVASCAATFLFMVSVIFYYIFTTGTDNQSQLDIAAQKWFLEQQQYLLTDDDLEFLLEEKVFDMQLEDQLVNEGLWDYLIENQLYVY